MYKVEMTEELQEKATKLLIALIEDQFGAQVIVDNRKSDDKDKTA